MLGNLSKSNLFSGLKADQIKEIEKIGHVARIDRGTLIFLQEDPAERLFVVLDGKIKIAKASPDGKEQILMLAGPGDSFGEAALFAGVKYPAGAEALQDSTIISFHRNKFISLIHENPDLAVNMIARLSTLLHHLTRLIQGLSLEDVGARLANYILELIPPDHPSSEPFMLELTEKKTVLAALFGTIPETLSRTFARLAEQNILEVHGPKIEIKNIQKLTEIAESGKF